MDIYCSNSIYLRTFKITDLNDLHRIMSDSDVAKNAGFKVKDTLRDTLLILDKFMWELENRLWAVVYKPTDTVIGWIEIHDCDLLPDPQTFELGFVLSKGYWGRGIMKVVIDSVLSYAFNNLYANRIFCAHFSDNLRSKRVIEKCNFTYYNTIDNLIYYEIKRN